MKAGKTSACRNAGMYHHFPHIARHFHYAIITAAGFLPGFVNSTGGKNTYTPYRTYASRAGRHIQAIASASARVGKTLVRLACISYGIGYIKCKSIAPGAFINGGDTASPAGLFILQFRHRAQPTPVGICRQVGRNGIKLQA